MPKKVTGDLPQTIEEWNKAVAEAETEVVRRQKLALSGRDVERKKVTQAKNWLKLLKENKPDDPDEVLDGPAPLKELPLEASRFINRLRRECEKRYADLGPQYTGLVRLYIAMMEQVELAKVNNDQENLWKFSGRAQTLISSLQRYTEAHGEAAVEAAMATGMADVVAVLERVVGLRQPELMRDILKSLADELPDLVKLPGLTA